MGRRRDREELAGLTKVGFEGVERLNALKIIPDLSHGSDLTALDVLKTSKSPVIISHGGARALVPNARCAPDEVIREVGESGGVMGIFMMSMWLTTDPEPSVDAYVRQIRHVINVAGIDAVGIANDYTIAGELTAAKAGNDNAKIISNYYAWWDSVAKQGVMGFNTRPPHAVIPELNNIRRMYPARGGAATAPLHAERRSRRSWAATGSACCATSSAERVRAGRRRLFSFRAGPANTQRRRRAWMRRQRSQ